MMKKNIFLLLLLVTFTNSISQEKQKPFESPKLVVGIVVDQMRYDFITRFWHRYGNGGFKKMINEGFNCKNNHFNYIPTYTGPGHASVYTGTTPSVHGIIGNDWYDKVLRESVYCAGDGNVTQVGTDSGAEKMSPHRMLVTTVTDQLRLATQMKSKVIAISVKDRGAVLPGGHTANAAYWFRGKDEGAWVTSSYYMDKLPAWVKKFNTSNAAQKYKTAWNTLYDVSTYTESGTDKNDFEGTYRGQPESVFPYNFPQLWDENGGFDIIKYSPFGNSVTTDFALAAIKEEGLGKDSITDFLAISYSSPDLVGHLFGVNSVEVQDTYLRLDKDLERLFTELDKKVGKGNYTVFLTADHGAVHVPSYLQSVKIPAGYFDTGEYRAKLDSFLLKEFKSDKLIKNTSNYQIFLDLEVIKSLGLKLKDVERALADEIINYESVAEVYTSAEMKSGNFTGGIKKLVQNGYNHKRSGNVMVILQPSVINYDKTGSTHGSGFNYDTHVPLLFYGMGINKGGTTNRTEITDIAPTISALLGIAFPNAATGQPISEVIDK